MSQSQTVWNMTELHSMFCYVCVSVCVCVCVCVSVHVHHLLSDQALHLSVSLGFCDPSQTMQLSCEQAVWTPSVTVKQNPGTYILLEYFSFMLLFPSLQSHFRFI